MIDKHSAWSKLLFLSANDD